MMGKDITQWPVFVRSRFIARIFQNPSAGTAPTLTLIENFRLASLHKDSKHTKVFFDDACTGTSIRAGMPETTYLQE